MIHYVCALQCEANPFIDWYKLKKNVNLPHFSVFQNEDISLIISGIGKINAAAATSYIHHLSADTSKKIWINVGLGGHRNHEVGRGFFSHKISDKASNRHYYPSFITKKRVPTDSIITVDRPEMSYPDEAIYDMEASGFFQTASKFSTVELIHAYKVISDNSKTPPETLSKQMGEQLVENHVKVVTTFTDNLRSFLEDDVNLNLVPFIDHWRFSVSEKRQLEEQLRRFSSLSKKEPWDPEYLHLSNAKQVLKAIENKIYSISLTY